MPLSQENVTTLTPMGANLVAGGATFRVWAPRADRVHLIGEFGGTERLAPTEDNRLVRDGNGYWAGFRPGVADGDEYEFHVVGAAGEGPKRDPYARELTTDPAYPHCRCIVRDPSWLGAWLQR